MSVVKCGRCDWKYPEEYLVPMCVNGDYTPPICGQCGLEITNEFHGIHLTKFKGEIAEEKRQDALAWRKRHPTSKAPV